jgi:hypothetical protein
LKNTLKIVRNKISSVKVRPGSLIAIIFMFLVTHTYATHIRSADIFVKRVCGTLTFDITIIAYLNSTSSTKFGSGQSSLNFGDGFTNNDLPTIDAILRPDLGTNVSVATFHTQHTYLATGTFQITYIERDRSRGVLNIADSEDVPYVTSVTITVDNGHGCNSFPVLEVISVDRACSGKIFYHNPGAYDSDGDSLSYELTIPASSQNTSADYDAPNSDKFYTDPAKGNEAKNAHATFQINSLTGLLTWDAPGAIGEYNIAFKIIEWRKEPDGSYTKVSTTIRDMQIIVEECDNQRPRLLLDIELCVLPGTPISSQIRGIDDDNHDVKIEAFSEVFQLSADPASFSPDPAIFQSSDPPAESNFSWTPSCSNVRQQPYQVVFKITDNPPDGPKLVSFETMLIRVQGPPPLLSASLDVVKHFGMLDLTNYKCENAISYEIWRKVGSFASNAICQPGVPRNSGYQLMGTTSDADMQTFVDTNFGNGLAAGAQYCYRVVAKIRDTKSRVSSEHCIGPVQRDAPVITHVSVEQTDTAGTTRISWRSPLSINKIQFPEPYQYHVYRAVDFTGESAIKSVGVTSDTTFADRVNNKDSVFNYRIVLYSQPATSEVYIPVDTSAVASSVRLNATPTESSIMLHWRDSVPWSNVVSTRPYHLIYRGEGFINDDQELSLIDSVNVIENGYYYSDNTVSTDELYSYKILTRGTYGNPAIALQQNFSQRVRLYPVNTLKPCVPVVTIDFLDCENFVGKFGCEASAFENTLEWSASNETPCRIDIDHYNVYAFTTSDTTKVLVGKSVFPNYTDSNLSSVARCYRVSAVDEAGTEGPLSEVICNENCPYYELPNVLTVNGDNFNEVFSSRFDGERCPRFVKSVNLLIYNRWGRVIYKYSSSDTNSVFIDWKGDDQNGRTLTAGLYYYVANVTFDVTDPSRRNVQIKSWLQIMR